MQNALSPSPSLASEPEKISRKDFLRGLWRKPAKAESADAQSADAQSADAQSALASHQAEESAGEEGFSWPLPPELSGPWLHEEAKKLGLDSENMDQQAMAKAVMTAMASGR